MRLGSIQTAALQLLQALVRAGGAALLPIADDLARLMRPLLQALADGALVPAVSTPPGTLTAVQVRCRSCSPQLSDGKVSGGHMGCLMFMAQVPGGSQTQIILMAWPPVL